MCSLLCFRPNLRLHLSPGLKDTFSKGTYHYLEMEDRSTQCTQVTGPNATHPFVLQKFKCGEGMPGKLSTLMQWYY